jgi:hypothetical protein
MTLDIYQLLLLPATLPYDNALEFAVGLEILIFEYIGDTK